MEGSLMWQEGQMMASITSCRVTSPILLAQTMMDNVNKS